MSNIIEISVKDDITPFIAEWLAKMPSWVSRLSRGLGWYSQKRIKALANDNRITSKYKARKPYKTVRKPLAGEYSQPPTDRTWWGKLRRAVGYQNKGAETVVGWTSNTAAFEGRIQEEGTNRRVTPALRAYYAAVAKREREKGVSEDEVLKVPVKPEIELAARPLFAPAMMIIQPEYSQFMTQKISEYIAGIQHAGVRKSKRNYKVFGG